MRFIAERVAQRRAWIERVLERLRREGHAPRCVLDYVSGSTHWYLGQPFQLEAGAGTRGGVELSGDRIQVTTRGPADPARVRGVLEAWYRERAVLVGGEILAERMPWFTARGHATPTVRYRQMRTRWGSLAGGQRMTLNLALVHASRECFEYVVVHELCHLEHRGHGRGFHRLMDELLADWRVRRQRLRAAGLI
jgi:predicted metal-dependent hydrolase